MINLRKNNTKVKNAFRGLFLCVALSCLCGCEHFLQAEDVADEIKAVIAYANASSYEIRVECDDSYGKITTPSIITKKISDSFAIEFKANPFVYFIGWQAYERSSNGKLTKLDSEYISFSEITSNSDQVYATKATFNKVANNIIIKPLCRVIPAVLSHTPPLGEISYANTPIVITFNMQMEDLQQPPVGSYFKYGNITIKSDDEDYSDCFEEPSFNEDKTVLTLNPRERALLNKLPNQVYTELKVTLSDSILVKSEGLDLPLTQNADSSFYVHYKKDVEQNPPQEFDFFVTRYQESIEELTDILGTQESDKMVIKTIDELSNSDILQNRTNGTIYIYGRYYDEESGVRKVKITETYQEALNRATNLSSGNIINQVYYEENDPDTYFFDEGNGIKFFIIKYEMESEDGIIQLDVNVIDACNNFSATKSLSLVKKSFIPSEHIYLGNATGFYDIYKNETNFDSTAFNNKIKSFYVASDEGSSCWDERILCLCEDSAGHLIDMPSSSFDVSYEYNYGNESPVSGDFSFAGQKEDEDDLESFYWTKTINVSRISGLHFKITIKDDMGNIAIQNYTVPYTTDIISSVVKSDSQASYTFYSKSCRYVSSIIKKWGNKAKYVSTNTSTPFVINSNESFYLCFNVDGFWTDLSETQYTSTITTSTPPALQWQSPKYTLEKSKTLDRGIDIKLNITNYSVYDLLIVTVTTYNSPSNPGYTCGGSTQSRIIKPDSAPFVNVQTEYLFGNSVGIKVKGVKSNSLTSETSFSVSKQTAATYDNVIPAVKSTYSPDYITYTGVDKQSGMKKVKATVLETRKEYEANGESLQVPLFDNWGNTIIYEAEDNAENIYSGRTIVVGGYNRIFESVEKLSTGWVLSTAEYTNGSLSTNMFASEIYKFVVTNNASTEGTWAGHATIPNTTHITLVDCPNGGKIGKRTITSSNLPSEPAFIKVLTKYVSNGYYGGPIYFYTGNQNSGRYDYILPNTKSSVLIASDAPVFVNTLTTEKSYSECKNWTAEEWEFYHNHIGDNLLEFTATDHSPQKYKIPVDQIESRCCYCVVAHFADGTTAISEVMVKD